jgi:hypothetical protein
MLSLSSSEQAAAERSIRHLRDNPPPPLSPSVMAEIQVAAQEIPSLTANRSATDKILLSMDLAKVLEASKIQMSVMQQQLQMQTEQQHHFQRQFEERDRIQEERLLQQEFAYEDRIRELQRTLMATGWSRSEPVEIASQSEQPPFTISHFRREPITITTPSPPVSPPRRKTQRDNESRPAAAADAAADEEGLEDSDALDALDVALDADDRDRSVSPAASGSSQLTTSHRDMPAAPKEEGSSLAQAQAHIRFLNAKVSALQQPKPKQQGGTAAAKSAQPEPPPAKESKRQIEKRIAVASGDKELLKKSTRIKKEAVSDDEAGDVLQELRPSIAAHNLFHPKNKKDTRTKHGHVKSSFVASSSSESTPDDSEEHSNPDDDEDDDTDWEPDSDVPTPSPHRPSYKSVSKKEFKEFQAFKRAANIPAPAPAAPPPDPPASTRQLQLMGPVLQLDQLEVDQHGRGTRTSIPEFAVAEKPPPHGNWEDIEYLMNTWLPLYEKYKKSCGTTLRFNTIWEIYTSTQKRRIARFLSKEVVRTEDDLEALTNDVFIQVMCAQKGHSTTALTEIALRKITFKGTLTERANWVNHEASWEECIAQCSANGAITAKRLVVIYRESIPDTFFQTTMSQVRFDTWNAAHDHMLKQIDNRDFLIPWHEDMMKRSKPKPDAPKDGKAQDPAKAGDQRKHESRDGHFSRDSPFDPMSFKLGKHTNVNPNFKKDFTLNPEKKACTRCNLEHRWTPEMCTNNKNKDGNVLTDLSSAQITERTEKRWMAGFFFSTAFRPSPSVQQAASAAATAVSKVGGGRA